MEDIFLPYITTNDNKYEVKHITLSGKRAKLGGKGVNFIDSGTL